MNIHTEQSSALTAPDRWTLAIFIALAIFFIAVAVAGGVIDYSPVPFWDMWNGTIDFYLRILNGDYDTWLAQHNEHRIVLSKGLFWLDYVFFNGSGKFLIVCNYLLVACTFSVLWLYLKAMLDKPSDRFARWILAAVIACLMFSWMQRQNLSWGFQSQFILAQNLPLLAFYLLYRASQGGTRAGEFFAAACLTGLLSAGTIASGVLALPLMTLLAFLMGLGRARTVALAGLSSLLLLAYFHDYVSVPQHGSLSQAVLEQPSDFIRFLLLYLGAPMHYTLLSARELSLFVGAALMLFCLLRAELAVKSLKASSLQLSLLCFMLYIGGMDFGTAGGRLKFGLDVAFSERYMTPVLTAWCVLLVLSANWWAQGIKLKPVRYLFVLSLMPVLLIPNQLSALAPTEETNFDRMGALLALELGIKDSKQIGLIYPHIDVVMDIARHAADKDLTIFSMPAVRDVGQHFGKVWPQAAVAGCVGSWDIVKEIDDRRYVKVKGWLYDSAHRTVPRSLHLLDAGHQVVGYALTGKLRPDVVSAVGNTASETSGFQGYLLAESASMAIILSADGLACELPPTHPAAGTEEP